MRLYVSITKDVYDSLDEGGIVRIPFNAHWIKRLCYSAKKYIPSQDMCFEHDLQECRQCFRNNIGDWVCYPFDTVLLQNGNRRSEWNVESVYYDEQSFCVKLKNINKSTKSAINEYGIV